MSAERAAPSARPRRSSTTRSTSSTRAAPPASPRAPRSATTTSSTTATSSARGCRYTEEDRVCIPVPFYHCFGMVMGNLGVHLARRLHGDPGARVRPGRDAARPSRTSAARRSTACRRCSSPSSSTRASASSTSPRCAPGSWPARRARSRRCAACVSRDAHGGGDDLLRHDRDLAGVDADRRRRPARASASGTVGRVHPHVEIKVVDPETGAIVDARRARRAVHARLQRDARLLGRRRRRTAEAIDRARWMHTGDLAVMDDDGYLNIVGRIKDMVIRGGENVYPREIEEFLMGHPDIADVQVVGVPDARYGEELMAWIVTARRRRRSTATRSPSSAAARSPTTRSRATFKCVSEFPMTVTGKVQKFKLRERAIEELGLARGVETCLSVCGRYTLSTVDGPEIAQRFGLIDAAVPRRRSGASTCARPRRSRRCSSPARARAVPWGLRPFREPASSTPINVRSETADQALQVADGRRALPRARRRLVRVAEAEKPRARRGCRSATRSTAACRSRSPGLYDGDGRRRS